MNTFNKTQEWRTHRSVICVCVCGLISHTISHHQKLVQLSARVFTIYLLLGQITAYTEFFLLWWQRLNIQLNRHPCMCPAVSLNEKIWIPACDWPVLCVLSGRHCDKCWGILHGIKVLSIFIFITRLFFVQPLTPLCSGHRHLWVNANSTEMQQSHRMAVSSYPTEFRREQHIITYPWRLIKE